MRYSYGPYTKLYYQGLGARGIEIYIDIYRGVLFILESPGLF
jgi:hypothetical protein